MPKKTTSPKRTTKSTKNAKSARVTTSSTARTTKKTSRTGLWALIAVLVILGVSFLLGWRAYIDGNGNFRVDQETTISGVVEFTALKPDPGDEGEVTLYVRKVGSSAWRDTGANLALNDVMPWTWSGALPAVHYEFVAVLTIDGEEIARTDEQFATAPAGNVEMALNVTWNDLPEDVVRPETTEVAGTAWISGYIPDNAVLQVYAIPRGNEYEIEAITPALLLQSELIATVPAPGTETDWSWNEAIPGEVYAIVGILRQGNQIIGISLEQLTVDAGQRVSDFRINSVVPAPDSMGMETSSAETDDLLALGDAGGRVLGTTSGNSAISGVVYTQGPQQENTSLLMLWKQPSTANYQVINRYPYPPQTGQAWTWSGATAGQQYQINAALQVNNNNVSTAPAPITVNAPATGVNFTLNTWYNLPATGNTPVFQTCFNNGGNSRIAQISIPTVQNAQQYWVQVGTSQNSSNSWNQQFSAGANNQAFQLKVPVTQGQQNFIQYSYATCDQCQGDDNFAPFSPTTTFTCY